MDVVDEFIFKAACEEKSVLIRTESFVTCKGYIKL